VSPLTIKQFYAKPLKECAEGKMLHSSLLFDIQKHFYLILPDPVQLQAIKLWLLPLVLSDPRLVKKNTERFSAADTHTVLQKFIR
jgi:hypothetical protein